MNIADWALAIAVVVSSFLGAADIAGAEVVEKIGHWVHWLLAGLVASAASLSAYQAAQQHLAQCESQAPSLSEAAQCPGFGPYIPTQPTWQETLGEWVHILPIILVSGIIGGVAGGLYSYLRGKRVEAKSNASSDHDEVA